MTAIVLVAGLTLAASFLCSLLEAALYSLTPAQLEVAKKNGVFGARRFAAYRQLGMITKGEDRDPRGEHRRQHLRRFGGRRAGR